MVINVIAHCVRMSIPCGKQKCARTRYKQVFIKSNLKFPTCNLLKRQIHNLLLRLVRREPQKLNRISEYEVGYEDNIPF